MYKPGDLIVYKPECELDEQGQCPHEYEEHEEPPYDNRARVRAAGPFVAYLPHSCDSWIIGGVPQILALIADLENALGGVKIIRCGCQSGEPELCANSPIPGGHVARVPNE